MIIVIAILLLSRLRGLFSTHFDLNLFKYVLINGVLWFSSVYLFQLEFPTSETIGLDETNNSLSKWITEQSFLTICILFILFSQHHRYLFVAFSCYYHHFLTIAFMDKNISSMLNNSMKSYGILFCAHTFLSTIAQNLIHRLYFQMSKQEEAILYELNETIMTPLSFSTEGKNPVEEETLVVVEDSARPIPSWIEFKEQIETPEYQVPRKRRGGRKKHVKEQVEATTLTSIT